MTCIHIHRKIFGFKINPQNTVTLGALHCNEFQPLMRYFCQMKLMMPASKQTPRLAHLKHCAFPVWAPFRIMQDVNRAERLSALEEERRVDVLQTYAGSAPLHPKTTSSSHPNRCLLSNTFLWAHTNHKCEELSQRGRRGTNDTTYCQRCYSS